MLFQLKTIQGLETLKVTKILRWILTNREETWEIRNKYCDPYVDLKILDSLNAAGIETIWCDVHMLIRRLTHLFRLVLIQFG